MKFGKVFLTSLFLLASLIFTSPVFAGGGGVDTRVTNTDDRHANTVIVYFDPKLFTCKGMHVSFNFETPEDGDMIKGTNGDNTSTITADAQMGKKFLRCSTHAIVYSKELKSNRILNISFNGANLEGSRQIAVSFGVIYNPNDRPLLPWESEDSPNNSSSPSPNINIWVLNQEVVPLDSRRVTVKWGAFDGYPGTFTVYVKPASNEQVLDSVNKNDWEEKFDGSKGPSATFSIRADQDYHIKVHGCMDKFGTCVDSNILLLPKIQIHENKVVYPSPSAVTEPSSDSDTEQLNQKMENLQKQLEESKQKQSALESRLNQLLSWIRSIFPFFK